MNPGELWSWVLLLPLGEQSFLQTVFAVPLHYLIILLHYLIIYAFLNPLRSIKMLHLQCGALDFSFSLTHLFSSFSSSQLTLESQNTSRSPFQCQMVQLGFLGSASHSEEGSHPYGLGTRVFPEICHILPCLWAANGTINIFISVILSVPGWSSWGHEGTGARGTSSNPN